MRKRILLFAFTFCLLISCGCDGEARDAELASNIRIDPIINEATEPNYADMGYKIVLSPIGAYTSNGVAEVRPKRVVEQTKNVNFRDISELPQNCRELNAALISSLDGIDNSEGYDESFFEENILIRITFEVGSGSYDYYVSSVYKDGEGRLAVGISQLLRSPYFGVTDDMAYWRVLIEADRSELGEVMSVSAVMETAHSFYETQLEGLHMQHMICLDENSDDYIFCYFTDQNPANREKWYKTIKEYYIDGKYELSDGVLVLKPSASHKNKLVFELTDSGFMYDSKKSKPVGEMPFEDGVIFGKALFD